MLLPAVNLFGVDDAFGLQCANGLETFLRKSSHQVIRYVPTVAEEMRSIWWSRPLLSNAPDNLNFGTRFIIQQHRVVQRESIAGQLHTNRLMAIIIVLLEVQHVRIRRFNGVQRLWRRRCMRSNRIVHDAEKELPAFAGFVLNCINTFFLND